MLGDVKPADAPQRTGPETRVEQVQDRMLHPADILIDRQPSACHLRVEGPVRRLACEADEIPARIHESVERVGFAHRIAPA
jgi:hypothetical protein